MERGGATCDRDGQVNIVWDDAQGAGRAQPVARQSAWGGWASNGQWWARARVPIRELGAAGVGARLSSSTMRLTRCLGFGLHPASSPDVSRKRSNRCRLSGGRLSTRSSLTRRRSMPVPPPVRPRGVPAHAESPGRREARFGARAEDARSSWRQLVPASCGPVFPSDARWDRHSGRGRCLSGGRAVRASGPRAASLRSGGGLKAVAPRPRLPSRWLLSASARWSAARRRQ